MNTEEKTEPYRRKEGGQRGQRDQGRRDQGRRDQRDQRDQREQRDQGRREQRDQRDQRDQGRREQREQRDQRDQRDQGRRDQRDQRDQGRRDQRDQGRRDRTRPGVFNQLSMSGQRDQRGMVDSAAQNNVVHFERPKETAPKLIMPNARLSEDPSPTFIHNPIPNPNPNPNPHPMPPPHHQQPMPAQEGYYPQHVMPVMYEPQEYASAPMPEYAMGYAMAPQFIPQPAFYPQQGFAYIPVSYGMPPPSWQ